MKVILTVKGIDYNKEDIGPGLIIFFIVSIFLVQVFKPHNDGEDGKWCVFLCM